MEYPIEFGPDDFEAAKICADCRALDEDDIAVVVECPDGSLAVWTGDSLAEYWNLEDPSTFEIAKHLPVFCTLRHLAEQPAFPIERGEDTTC